MTARLHKSMPLLALLLSVLAGCSAPDSGTDAAAAPETAIVSLLLFEEQEPGIEPYPVRILVGTDYLRIDDDQDDGDFVLLNRNTGSIHSVSHENRSILVINRQPLAMAMPADLTLRYEALPGNDAPTIDGIQPQQYRYYANDELCYEAVVVPGLMQDTVAGLIEYEMLLAGQQAGTLENTPAQFRTPCYLARYIFAPARHMRQGLPVQEWDAAGYRRLLVRLAADESVPSSLFELPQEYASFSINSSTGDAE